MFGQQAKWHETMNLPFISLIISRATGITPVFTPALFDPLSLLESLIRKMRINSISRTTLPKSAVRSRNDLNVYTTNGDDDGWCLCLPLAFCTRRFTSLGGRTSAHLRLTVLGIKTHHLWPKASALDDRGHLRAV